MPDGIIELSGFCVGAAEKSELVDPTRIAVGDVLVGYPSDGFHANGWSLVRRILKANPGLIDADEWDAFLAPTRLYHDVVAGLKAASDAGLNPVKVNAVENLHELLEAVPVFNHPFELIALVIGEHVPSHPFLIGHLARCHVFPYHPPSRLTRPSWPEPRPRG